MPAATLSLADQACLVIIGERPTHERAIVKLLAPQGELGRIWSLNRALTYRSIDRLVEFGLIERSDAGRRAELRITASGRRGRRAWPLIRSQREQLTPAIAALTDRDPTDVVALWRHEAAQAAARFLQHLETT